MPDDEKSSGELSEVASRKAAGPTTPGDAVAGHPFDDDVQEGATGPNARTGDEDVDAEEYRIDDGDPEAVVDEQDSDAEAVVDEEDASPPSGDDEDAYPRAQDGEEDRA